MNFNAFFFKQKKGIIERIRALKTGKNKVKNSEAIILDETLSTDCSTSLSHEKVRHPCPSILIFSLSG